MSSANGCCGVCKATGGCESWTFHTNGTKAGLCHLHSAAGNPTPYNGVISGIVTDAQQCKTITGYTPGNGHNCRGGHINVSVPEQCCAACRAEPTCQAWKYNSDRSHISGLHDCWLHTATATRRRGSIPRRRMKELELRSAPEVPVRRRIMMNSGILYGMATIDRLLHTTAMPGGAHV